MKNIVYLIFILFYTLNIKKTNAQEVRNVITSKLFIGLKNKREFSIETSINLKSEPQLDFSYLVSKKIAVFGSYNYTNWRNKRYTFLKGLFGGPGYDYVENKNSGYTFGIGFLNLLGVKKNNQLELLLGFENYNLSVLEYYPTRPEDIDFIEQKYSKLFLQINHIHFLDRITLGYTLKTSYFKVNSLTNLLDSNFSLEKINLENDNLFLFDIATNIEYSFQNKSPLFLTFQIGIAGALDDFEQSVNREGFWGINLNIGLKYKFL